jgi:DNA-directed RNA polymerase subunit RPC12/RpoP
MATEDWCLCWRTPWQFDVMADDKGVCKHCGLRIAYFFRGVKQ